MIEMASFLDYASRRHGSESPPSPMLLDTCLIQHLEFVMDILGEEFVWPADTDSWLTRRYGAELGSDLIALGNAVAYTYPRGDPPWAVSQTSWEEVAQIGGEKGSRLRGWWQDWAAYWEGLCEAFPDVDADALWQPVPAEDPNQLELFVAPRERGYERAIDEGFGPFADLGDRALICDALRANVPAILTTDIRSFWTHREWLHQVGIEVWRPRDLWAAVGAHAVPQTAA
jgi:hypothetical protein